MRTRLVLLGGGHSHAIALKLWGLNPLPNVELILVNQTPHTPYSGMLPGHIAGFYSYTETHIDLSRLCKFAQAQFYLQEAVGLDLIKRQLLFKQTPPISFEILSIDIGSTPCTTNVPGAAELAIPIKPVHQFLPKWQQLLTQLQNHPHQALVITIVGGGAGGVELALNIDTRLKTFTDKLTIHILHRHSRLMPNHSAWVSNKVRELLNKRGIHVHLSTEVNSITTLSQNQYSIATSSNLALTTNVIFWVTQACAPTWIRDSGLECDHLGFITVKNTLQSVSHPEIFAAGDIANIENYPCPKAGVFAVRQGKPLYHNLQALIKKQPLKDYIPQKRYLSLISTGEKAAIASWGQLGWQSRLLWYLKDYIDRQFMRFLD